MAMFIMLAVALLNIVLDAIFILGLKMSIDGAALATVIGESVSFLLLIYFLYGNKTGLKMHFSLKVYDPVVIKEIVKIGFTSFMINVGNSILVVIINNVLRGHGGTEGIAVYGVINKLTLFIIMPVNGIAQGVQPIFGYSFGAKNFERAKKVMRPSFIVSLAYGLFFVFLMEVFPKQILQLFSLSGHTLEMGIMAARINFMFMFSAAVVIINTIIFQAIGKTLPVILVTLLRQFILLVPLVIILPIYFEANGVFMSFPISDAIAGLITIGLMWWLHNNLEKLPQKPKKQIDLQ